MPNRYQFSDDTLRFLAKVNKDTLNSCWERLASTNEFGYGRFRVGGRAGKTVKAHRHSYELHKGAIPSGLNVLHRCDNPLCVNPDHLFLGTKMDNTRDMMSKGRHNMSHKGEDASRVILTEEQVIDIRKRRATSTLRQLATEYGVAPMTIHNAATGQSWSHIQEGLS